MEKIIIPLTLTALLFFSLKSKKVWALPEKGKPFEQIFRNAEMMYGLPKNLLARMAQQESNYNTNAKGTSGEIGIMQITPKWHPELTNPYDAQASIFYAGKYIKQLHNQFGNFKDAIAAYNWGPGNLSNYKKGIIKSMPAITIKYVNDVASDVL